MARYIGFNEAEAQEIGEIVYSFQPLDEIPDSRYVRAGQTYLQSAYPELFDVIGIGQSVPSIRQGAFFTGSSSSIGNIYNIESIGSESYIALGVSSADNQDRVAYLTLNGGAFSRVSNAAAFDSLPVRYGDASQCRLMSGNKQVLAIPDNQSGSLGAGGGFYVYEKSGGSFSLAATVRSGRRGALAINTDNELICHAARSTSNALELYKFNGSSLTNLTSNIDVNITTGTTLSAVDFRSDYAVVLGNTGLSLYKVNAQRNGLIKLTTPAGLAAGTTALRSARLSEDATHLLVASTSSPYIEVYERAGDSFVSQGSPSGVPSDTLNALAFNDDGSYFSSGHNATSGANRFRLWKTNGLTRVDNVDANPSQTVQAICLSTDMRYAFLSEGSDITAYEAFYPFDADTEFYVPDVADLSPGQVGDWVPSVTGKAYVRAK